MDNEMVEDRTTTAEVGAIEDMPIGTMRMAKVGEHRIVVIRSESGVHALDNACPHQGYGLATGSLDGEQLTCQWHNWKYDVATGRCLRGEEDVVCHPTSVSEGQIVVSVTTPTDEQVHARVWPSLRRGLETDSQGQIARDSVRLLDAGVTPAEVVWAGVSLGAPKAEYGPAHEMALAADCLAWAEIREGDDRVLPLVEALAGIAERTRDRPVHEVPEPSDGVAFDVAVETESIPAAMASVLARLESGADVAEIRHDFVDAASQHHLGYGHGIIYVQKAFELLGRVGWENAPGLLPHLAASLVHMTREDHLPYMKKAMRPIAEANLSALADGGDRVGGAKPDEELVSLLLAADEAPIELAIDVMTGDLGVPGLLDALSLAVSRRMLGHDLECEIDATSAFGWLDITHGLTMARAVRWAWEADPGPHTARLALFATWLMFDTGRFERRTGRVAVESSALEGERGDVRGALHRRDPEAAVAHVLAADPGSLTEVLSDAALSGRSGSFIVSAHLVKTAQAAIEEAGTTGSQLPVAAAARLLAAPRLERFVALNAAESVEFIRTGRPPQR